MNKPIDNAQSLLQKAANDLVAGQATLNTGQAFDTVCFHAQQAVEKSIKAVLALHDVVYPWTHNVSELLRLASPWLPALAPYAERMVRLTPYAIGSRHDMDFAPPQAETTEALRLAREVHQLIQSYVNDKPQE